MRRRSCCSKTNQTAFLKSYLDFALAVYVSDVPIPA
jgi:hypothetical protein